MSDDDLIKALTSIDEHLVAIRGWLACIALIGVLLAAIMLATFFVLI